MYKRQIDGYPDSDFIWFTQDDNYLNLDINQFNSIFTEFLKYDANFSCWRTAHFHYKAPVTYIDKSKTFKLAGFTFKKGWWSYGDSGVFMNRSGAKIIFAEVLKQRRFMEGLIEDDVYYLEDKGFYTNCDPPKDRRDELPYLHNAICYLPPEELSERDKLNSKGSI